MTKRKKFVRYHPQARREAVMQAALDLSEETNYLKVTHDTIADRARCTRGLVRYYLGNIDDLRDAVVAAAIHTIRLRVIAQALSSGHPYTSDMPEDLKAQVLASL